MSENNELAVQALRELKESCGFDISVCNDIPNIEDNPKFHKLAVDDGQKMKLSGVTSQLPALIGAHKAADLASKTGTVYLVNCPLGIENTLVQMKNGNYANFIRTNNHFIGYAPITPVSSTPVSAALTAQAVATAAFATMSVAVGQYYLTQINGELKGIRQGMDKILEFLYGDKKAELISEVSFAKYAYENFSSIMQIESQTSATIASLQEAKKVAMKDAEFYISDLGSTLNDSSDITETVNKACSIQETLDLALQLAVMSSILEVYYSHNFNKEYLAYIEKDLSLYIDKCEKFVLSSFSKLHEKIENVKTLPTKRINKPLLLEKVHSILDPLQNGNESELKYSLHNGLYSYQNKTNYYISDRGDIYIRNDQ